MKASKTGTTHPNRVRLLAFLRANPGASLQDIADHLGVHRTAAQHHVRVLVGSNEVVAVRQGRRTLHFPPGHVKAEHRSLVGFLRQSTVRELLHAVAADPSISWRRLARQLDLTPHTVRWHVQRLQREGVVEVRSSLTGHVMVLERDVLELVRRSPAATPAASLMEPPAAADWSVA